jgi:ubiquinone/menaquinone biosynthesis C-methylase UbiE
MMKISTAILGKPDVVNVYTKMALFYNIWGKLTESQARENAILRAGIQNGQSVLEVAVGTGLTFFEILKLNPDGENVGIDLTPAMLEKARQLAAKSTAVNYQLTTGDAYNIQYPDQHFDLVMNNYMFDLLPEEDFLSVLIEFKRVLKTGGRLVLVNMTKGEHFYQQIWEEVYKLNPRWLGGCRGILLGDSLKTAGFHNLKRKIISQFGFPSEIITATN